MLIYGPLPASHRLSSSGAEHGVLAVAILRRVALAPDSVPEAMCVDYSGLFAGMKSPANALAGRSRFSCFP
eukprot:1166544-Pyramimonas_sp.AAC.1